MESKAFYVKLLVVKEGSIIVMELNRMRIISTEPPFFSHKILSVRMLQWPFSLTYMRPRGAARKNKFSRFSTDVTLRVRKETSKIYFCARPIINFISLHQLPLL